MMDNIKIREIRRNLELFPPNQRKALHMFLDEIVAEFASRPDVAIVPVADFNLGELMGEIGILKKRLDDVQSNLEAIVASKLDSMDRGLNVIAVKEIIKLDIDPINKLVAQIQNKTDTNSGLLNKRVGSDAFETFRQTQVAIHDTMNLDIGKALSLSESMIEEVKQCIVVIESREKTYDKMNTLISALSETD